MTLDNMILKISLGNKREQIKRINIKLFGTITFNYKNERENGRAGTFLSRVSLR